MPTFASRLRTKTVQVKILRRGATLALAGLALLPGPAGAQPGPPRGETVTWTVSAPAKVRPGARVALTLRGTVVDGWHVYAQNQLPNGPTPLRVTVAGSEIAVAEGAPIGSRPVTTHDPSFDLDTQYYAKPFTVTAPVRIGPRVAAGPQQIPVSVRFQTCNGEICQPPKTVRLSASVDVAAGR